MQSIIIQVNLAKIISFYTILVNFLIARIFYIAKGFHKYGSRIVCVHRKKMDAYFLTFIMRFSLI
jgi:hypothetical protein